VDDDAWLLRTPSPNTRKAYERDLGQFLEHAGIAALRSPFSYQAPIGVQRKEL